MSTRFRNSLRGFSALMITLGMMGCMDKNPSDSPKNTPETGIEKQVSIPKPHIVQKTYAFRLGKESVNQVVGLDTQNVAACRIAPKSYSYSGASLPANWQQEYFEMFLGHPSINSEAQVLSQSLRQHANNDKGAWAEAIVAFVQGAISYDWHTFHRISESKIRYPLETLADGTGVCADKSLLLARLLKELDYELVLFVFEKANHMGVGIRVPQGYGDFGTPFAFIESTNYTPIGRIPEKYVGNIRLERTPKVYTVPGSGKAVFDKIVANRKEEQSLEEKYGKEFLFYSPEQKDIQVKMHQIQSQMSELDKKIKENGCTGTVSAAIYEKCKEIVDKKNELVNQYNELVNEFNAMNQQAV